MRKYLLLNCKKAGELIEKKQLQGLPLFEAFKLWYHLRICSMCEQYQADSKQLSQWIEQGLMPPEDNSDYPTAASLTAAEKVAMHQALAKRLQDASEE